MIFYCLWLWLVHSSADPVRLRRKTTKPGNIRQNREIELDVATWGGIFREAAALALGLKASTKNRSVARLWAPERGGPPPTG